MSFSKITAVSSALALVSTVAAHGTVTGIVADGVYYEGYHANFQYLQTQPVVVGWSTPDDLGNGFIAPDAYGTSDIICHLNATNAQTSATVSAGGTVELQWTAWPSSHHGPVIDYLANCNGDCKTVDKTTLEFFKIDGVGLLDDTTVPGDWATDTLIANNNSWTVAIPSDIAPGNYVLRHEIIALHSAGTVDGAQNYPQCFNLEVTGSGSATPSGTLGTALYTETDPGIEINIYTSLSTYDVPGPTLFSGATSVSQTLPSAPTSIAPVGTAVASAAAGVTTSAVTSATQVSSSPSSGITSVEAIVASGAPFFNRTATVTSKSKSACKTKPSAVSVTIPPMSSAPAVTSSSSGNTSSSGSSSNSSGSSGSDSDPSSPSSAPSASSTSAADTTLPSGTTLNTLLSWLSSFYNSVKGTDYSSDTTASIARRAHARAVVPSDFGKFDKVKLAAAGTHSGLPHGTGEPHPHHHHHHPHPPHGTGPIGTGSARPTGIFGRSFGDKAAFAPTGVFPSGTGFPHPHHHHHPHGTGTSGAARPTGPFGFGAERQFNGEALAPTGTGSFSGFPHGTGLPRPHHHHHHPHGNGTVSASVTVTPSSVSPTGFPGVQRRQESGFPAPSGTGVVHHHHHHHPHGTGAPRPTGSGWAFPSGGARPTGWGGRFRMPGGA